MDAASPLFAAIARRWREAALSAGAEVAVSAPPEDLRGWREALPESGEFAWIEQRGGAFGARLEDSFRQATRRADRVIVTGGDVVPSRETLARAFELLDAGADVVLAPSPDGGVSLLSIPAADADLLSTIGRRRRDVFRRLQAGLLSRGRAVAVVEELGDVDGRRSARRIAPPSDFREITSLIRRACARGVRRVTIERARPDRPVAGPSLLRGPPLAA